MNPNSLTVVEPQSVGMVHAPFNAALLHTLLLAYPDTTIYFHSLESHREQVAEIVQEYASDQAARVVWMPFAPASATSSRARWIFHQRLLKHVLAAGKPTLFCSISRMQLLQLTRLMQGRSDLQVRVVLHGELEQLELEHDSVSLSKLKGWLRPFTLHRILSRQKPRGLRYLLLGQSIRDHIPERYAAVFADAGVCDHPYHFVTSGGDLPADASAPVFGIFGNCGEAYDLESVARAVRSEEPSTRLRMIGFVSGPDVVERLHTLVEDVGIVPVSRSTFTGRAQSITHALWLGAPGSFRLRASGTFFDALSNVKPLIYTANPFVDAYTAKEPAIAVRCESVRDVPQAMLEVKRRFDPAAYAEAQQAILRLRERFTPQALAPRLAAALDWDV